MQIHLYRSIRGTGKAEYEQIKSIELDFLPRVDDIYLDKETGNVYRIDKVFYTEKKISVIVVFMEGTTKELYSSLS